MPIIYGHGKLNIFSLQGNQIQRGGIKFFILPKEICKDPLSTFQKLFIIYMKFYIFHKRRLSSLRIKLDEDGKQYTYPKRFM